MGIHPYDAVAGSVKRPVKEVAPEPVPQEEGTSSILERLKRDQARALVALERREKDLTARVREVGEREESVARREAAVLAMQAAIQVIVAAGVDLVRAAGEATRG